MTESANGKASDVFRAVVAGLSCLLLAACGDSAASDAEPAFKSLDGIDQTFLDTTADPCADFYQFSCGSWVREHPADVYPARARFFEGSGRNSELLGRILEGKAPVSVDLRVSTFYATCLAAQPLPAARDLDPLLSLIATVSTQELPTLLGKLHRSGVSALFGAAPAVDLGEPSRRIVSIYPSGLSLPDRDYYLDPALSVRAELLEHVQRLVSLYGLRSGVQVDAEAIVDFETALATATPSDAEARNPFALHNPLDLAALTASTPGFDWSAYFAAVGARDVASVNVMAPVYLDALVAKLEAPLSTWKSYLTFRTLEAYGDTLGVSIAEEEARFHNGVFFGVPTPSPDFVICREQTAASFPFELAKPFVEYRTSPEDRSAATTIFAGIVAALEQDLAQAEWLDARSRDEALAKLDSLVAHIAFPDSADWPATTFPAQVGSYLGQRMDTTALRWTEAWANLNQPVDRRAWLGSILATNAWYDATANTVTLPAGILQFPQYTAKRRSVLNYGTLGSVLGHELTHAFDDSGRHFDAEGRLRDWWTPESAAEYERRASCVSDQYSSYEALPGLGLDGRATLGENIADLGGLKLAHAAYRASGSRDAAQGRFDSEQLFFLSYAQLWCASFSDDYTAETVVIDPHSPPRFRVNGVVRNIPEFREAFHCPAGAELAPAERCSVF